ncbi:acyl carrier protein [Exiguobacterium sp. ERU656]|uniref:acyl carrier protein n=1 Tax=Exiguobacterium sp. ERU656 TaxID=2751217 RepID=UPI001BECDF92|nr:acyl carrier protein [Exiguobacterium sp. ERU656]
MNTLLQNLMEEEFNIIISDFKASDYLVDIGLNSLEMVILILEIEKITNSKISYEEFSGILTIEELNIFFDRRLAHET